MTAGFGCNPDSLTQMANTLHSSASSLAKSASGAPPSPDAGDSSALIAKVISDLLKSCAAIAAKQDSIADKIHASKGSYDDVENNNAGDLKLDQRYAKKSSGIP